MKFKDHECNMMYIIMAVSSKRKSSLIFDCFLMIKKILFDLLFQKKTIKR